jgi:hypothetical protein
MRGWSMRRGFLGCLCRMWFRLLMGRCMGTVWWVDGKQGLYSWFFIYPLLLSCMSRNGWASEYATTCDFVMSPLYEILAYNETFLPLAVRVN